ncbi:MAG: ATP-binding protein, partial [Vicinamibacterales bacterium]
GIPPEQRERVFEMFGRLHDRETYAGTGIGLAIARRIVERHGGEVWSPATDAGGAARGGILIRVPCSNRGR